MTDVTGLGGDKTQLIDCVAVSVSKHIKINSSFAL